MNVNDLYPSKYVKSDDLGTDRMTLQVSRITMEEVEEGAPAKPVMYFHGKDKGMVLNKTNALLCAHAWGQETDQWTNQTLELFSEPKMFQGKVVNGLSVAPKLPNSSSAPAPTPGPMDAVQPGKPDDFSDIPF